MEKCPFDQAGLCDADHPIEVIPDFDRFHCIALRYLWTKEHKYPVPVGTEEMTHIPEHFSCHRDGSMV